MLQAFMHGTGLAASVNSAFGEPELLDDLLDHWSADIHKEEKVALLHMLQVGEGKGCNPRTMRGSVTSTKRGWRCCTCCR